MALPAVMRRLVIVGIAVSVATSAIMVLGYSRARPERLLQTLQELSGGAILLGLGFHFLALSFWALRCYTLARPFSDRFGVGHAYEAVFASVFAAALTPGRVGGEAARFAVLTSHGVPRREGGLLTMLERGLDLIFFVLGGILAAFVLVPILGLPGLKWFLFVGILLAMVFIALPVVLLYRPHLLHGPIHLAERFVGRARVERAKNFVVLEAYRVRESLGFVMRRSRFTLVIAAALTVVYWTSEFMVLKVMLDAAGRDINLVAVFLGAIVVMIVSALPFLPGGAGLAEVAAYGVFAPMAPGLSPGFVIGWRAVTYYVDLAVGGTISVRFAHREINRVFAKKKDQAADPDLAGLERPAGPGAADAEP